jgi:hypothetical protein
VPNWLVVVLVLIAVVPGVVIVLAGVFAMFVMPADANGREGERELAPAAESDAIQD